jgi:ribosomal protein L11 methylase PrmA
VLVSGLIASQEADTASTLAAHGLRLVRSVRESDWVALVMRRDRQTAGG